MFLPKPGSSLIPMEGLLGVPEESRAQRCPGSGPLPVSRASAAHPNPAWQPKSSSLLATTIILHQQRQLKVTSEAG
jgi:hypothetical protein